MQVTLEYINEFIIDKDDPNDWADGHTYPSIWIQNQPDVRYTFEKEGPDPYDLATDLVNLVKQERTAALLMPGWMTKLPSDDEDNADDDMEVGDRIRVRVILVAGPQIEPTVAVQRFNAGTTVFPDMGEGMFPEVFRALMADN